MSAKDPALLVTLHEVGLDLTRQDLGHAGVILFRRSVPTVAYGR
jgi:hypothetical protein